MKIIISKLLNKVVSSYYVAVFLRIYFHLRHGKIPRGFNFKIPRTFNEKINYLKLYKTQKYGSPLADKIDVKEFVKNKIGEEYLIPTIKTYNLVEEIAWQDLPSSFVIKASHASGMSFICRNKDHIDKRKVLGEMSKWLMIDYASRGGEWQYNFKPRLICERYLENTKENQLLDYKFFCFDGEPKFIQVDIDRFYGHTRNIYDLNWILQPFTLLYKNANYPIEKPKKLAEMIDVARKLSQGFYIIRVDLYYYQEQVYFGELTFHPEGGSAFIRPYKYDYILGNLVKINGDRLD